MTTPAPTTTTPPPATGSTTGGTTAGNGHAARYDKTEIKRAAAGRWPEILSAFGIPREFLHFDNREGPCPKCGGDTRFRGLDEQAGALFCSHCFSERNGDGIAAVMWWTGKTLPEVCDMLGGYLGIHAHGNGRAYRKQKTPASAAALTKETEVVVSDAASAGVLKCYAAAKPPVTPEGIRECGGVPVRWFGHVCIRFEGREPVDAENATAVVLVKNDGKMFPAVGKVGERKTHTVKDSINSWLVCGDVATAETIIDLEGVTDWLALASVGLPPKWAAVTNTAGAKARGKLSRPWAAGKRIVVAGDADEPGQDGMQRSAAAYIKAGAAEVLLARLPYEIAPDHGKDLRDWLLEGHKPDELPTEAVTPEQAAEWAKKTRATNSEREIIIGTDESRVVDQAIEALSTCDNIYQRGGCLVQVVQGTKPPRGIARPQNAPRIAPARFPRIREHLADAAVWLRPAGENEMERVHPPDWVVKAIDARGEWKDIRHLEAVVQSPILRMDGSVLQRPGYDPATGIIFAPEGEFPKIPDKPNHNDAIQARDALLEVVRDFPFRAACHRAAWLAGLLTPLARYAFFGPAPLFLFDANTPGTGKTLLVDVNGTIITGSEMAKMSLPREDDEARKRITSIALAGEPFVLIDNIPNTLGSPSLDAALTATSWSDRILGQSAMASGVPLYTTWYATGNNVALVGDTSRRVVHVRLESPVEKPEERTDFLHPDLMAWVKRERPRLTTAALTILAGFCAAGRPSTGLKPWGSFEAWSDLVREAIVWADLPDPGETRVELVAQTDREAGALRQLLDAWNTIDPTGQGVPVSVVVRELAEHPDEYDDLRAALWEFAPPKDGKTLNPRSIGMKLHHHRRRIIGGKRFDKSDTNRGAAWLVLESSSDTSDSSDTSPTYRTHAQAHARENRETPRATVTTVSTVTTPGGCPHPDVAESPTSDGYINRTCRVCGANLRCRKQEQPA